MKILERRTIRILHPSLFTLMSRMKKSIKGKLKLLAGVVNFALKKLNGPVKASTKAKLGKNGPKN